MSHGDLPRFFLCHGDVGMTSTVMLLSGYPSLTLYTRRFPLRPVLYPVRFPLVTYPTGRYSCLVRLRILCLFVLVSSVLVYILGWR